MKQWLSDVRWAVNMFCARRVRRELGFAERIAFDDAMRPRFEMKYPDERTQVIDYPDAIYHTKVDDLIRAIKAATRERLHAHSVG